MKICISKKYRQHNGQKKKDKKHTHKTAKRVTRTPLKTGVKITCSGRVSSSCSTRDTRRVNLVKKTHGGTYPWSFVKQIFHSGQPSHGGDLKTFEVMTST